MILCVCSVTVMSRARTNIKSTKRLVCLYQKQHDSQEFFSLYYGRKAKGAGVRGKSEVHGKEGSRKRDTRAQSCGPIKWRRSAHSARRATGALSAGCSCSNLFEVR